MMVARAVRSGVAGWARAVATDWVGVELGWARGCGTGFIAGVTGVGSVSEGWASWLVDALVF